MTPIKYNLLQEIYNAIVNAGIFKDIKINSLRMQSEKNLFPFINIIDEEEFINIIGMQKRITLNIKFDIYVMNTENLEANLQLENIRADLEKKLSEAKSIYTYCQSLEIKTAEKRFVSENIYSYLLTYECIYTVNKKNPYLLT